MAPPLLSFPASSLPENTHTNARGQYRKGWNGDLKSCELLEMAQYRCALDEVETVKGKEGAVRCVPIERLFRLCKDNKSTFMVETTSWEKGLREEREEEKKQKMARI